MKALVTGASRGIGHSIAIALAKKGYDLYLTCNNNGELLQKNAAKIEEAFKVSCKCYCFSIDNEQEVKKMFEDIGSLDVLVNNAGISYVGLLSDMDYGQWQRVIGVNLNGCFLTCREAIPSMVKKKSGKIINISSVWGNVGASMEAAYSASKGGVNALTRALGKELAPSNIQVNAIACGVIDTDMNRCFDSDEMDALVSEIPADRMGRADEVAELVVKLCDGCGYLNGQVITLDGAWT